jgi:hypothetical protein
MGNRRRSTVDLEYSSLHNTVDKRQNLPSSKGVSRYDPLHVIHVNKNGTILRQLVEHAYERTR